MAAGLFNAVAQGIGVRIVLDQWTAYPGNEAGVSIEPFAALGVAHAASHPWAYGRRRTPCAETGRQMSLVTDRGLRGQPAVAGRASRFGNVNVNVDPLPTALSAQMRPP